MTNYPVIDFKDLIINFVLDNDIDEEGQQEINLIITEMIKDFKENL